jgi:peptidoglycan/LPS O-acetylase OafA/YrhL
MWYKAFLARGGAGLSWGHEPIPAQSAAKGLPTGNFAIYWIIWGLGAGLAELVKRNRLPQWGVGFYMLGVAALVLALAAYVFKVSALLQNWAWASFYFLLMLWGLTQKHPLHWMGAGTRNVLSRIGLMSYSLYLIHFHFSCSAGCYGFIHFGSKPANFLIPITFTLICLPIAYALHLCVEMPSHHLARKTSTRDVTTSVNLTVVNK